MENKDYDIKMDGEFHQFEGGGIRYTKTGKGRFDLIPVKVVNHILSEYILFREIYKTEYKFVAVMAAFAGDYPTAIIAIVNEVYTKKIIPVNDSTTIIPKVDILTGFSQMLKDLAIHYEKGADKYGVDNWKKGIPLQSFRDSGLRHLSQWLAGETDEPHAIAAIWNFFGAIYLNLTGGDNETTDEPKEDKGIESDDDAKQRMGWK